MAEETKAVAATGFGGGLGDLTQEQLLEIAQKSGADKGSADAESIRDAMGNVRPRLEMVKVKGHGANLFQFEDDSKVAGDEGLVGVIVAFTRHNSWFGGKAFGEGESGALPPCFSNDGDVVAPNAEDPQASACSVCPRNKDAKDQAARNQAFERAKDPTKGSAEVGSDSVCNNYVSMAVVLAGRDLPVRLRLTRSSFKSWAAYVQRIGTVEGRFLPHEVVTQVKLTNTKGSFGEYSVAGFNFVGALPTEMREQFAKQSQVYRALLQFAAEQDEQEGGDASEEAAAAMAKAKDDAAQADEAGL